MFRSTHYAFSVMCLFALLLTSSVVAQTPIALGTNPTDSVLPGLNKSVAQLIEGHQERVQALKDSGQLSRQHFDLLFDDLISDLERISTLGHLAEKSGNSCNQACKAADTGTVEICNAASQAALALAACPDSTHAFYAEYYSSNECLISTTFTVPFSCMGPVGQTQALGWLDGAKRRSRDAWNEAAFAFQQDGCEESYQTAIHASAAYFSFHNAATFMANCS